MSNTTELAVQAVDLKQALSQRADFKAFAHDISNAVLFALERRHLEYLDVSHAPPPQSVQTPSPGDLFFLKVTQIGHGVAVERSLDVLNVQNILGTFRDGSHNLVVGLSADGAQSHLYLGARKVNVRSDATPVAYDFVQNLRRAVEGNLPGTRFEDDGERAETKFRTGTAGNDRVFRHIIQPLQSFPYLAALTGIPSLRAERQEQFAQSLDRLVQALQGQRYLLLIIAEPLQESAVSEVLSDGLRLSSEVHSWVRLSANYAQAIGEAVAQGRSEGRIRNQTEAESRARSVGKGYGRQPGAIVGGLLGAGLGLALSPLLGPASIGIGGMASYMSTGLIGSVSDNISDSDSTSRSETWGESVTDSLTNTSSKTETNSMTVEYLNKTAQYCEQVIDGYVQRLQRGKNLGMWNVGVYFLAEDPATFAQGQAQLRALYSGRETYFEPMRTVDLSDRLMRGNVGIVLSTFSNPVLDLTDAQTSEPLRHPLGKLHRSLSTPLNTEELALLMNLPRREVPGLKLELVADFGVNPKPLNRESAIVLGKVVSGGATLDIPVGVELRDLTRHVFVTGITGSGKTNTCFALLKAAARRGVPFLVIEPAKGEYRMLMDDPDVRDLRVYTPGDETISPFRINPFQFVPGVNLVTHLDHLKSIFNASFPMYAAMPYLLEEAMVGVYEDRGWDLATSTNRHFDMSAVVENWRRGAADDSYVTYLPTLSSLYRKIDEVVERKGYAEEVTKNYAAALKARIHSLMLGSKGRMLDTQRGVPFDELFGRPTVLELRSMGDDDEKCFLMALLLTQLYQYQEQRHRWRPQSGLRHLTILEESHRLLGRAATGGSLEVANPRGKAVETFANMLAEIREYGEGFLIVDQTPAKLIPDVVKNTSTKILHRLAARDDREFVGEAMGMTPEQVQFVPRLRVGDALIHTEDQDKPVWVKVDALKDARGTVTDEQILSRMASHHQRRTEAELTETVQRTRSLAERVRRLTERLRREA